MTTTVTAPTPSARWSAAAPRGAPIGVAPGAQAIVAKAMGANGTAQGSDLLAAAQWMTDPDGDPATADYPTVINNSWSAPGADNEWFRPMVQTWVAMGIVPVFAAGNTAGSIGNPASYPEAIAVGALEESGQVAASSSRGLVNWTIDGTPTTIMKPDITAPGVFITSTLGSGYGLYSGSSMAAPHVAGTIALLRQARPDLTLAQVRELLRATAVDRGTPGPDLDYGAGALDAAAAVAATGAPQIAPAVSAGADRGHAGRQDPGPRAEGRASRQGAHRPGAHHRPGAAARHHAARRSGAAEPGSRDQVGPRPRRPVRPEGPHPGPRPRPLRAGRHRVGRVGRTARRDGARDPPLRLTRPVTARSVGPRSPTAVGPARGCRGSRSAMTGRPSASRAR